METACWLSASASTKCLDYSLGKKFLLSKEFGSRFKQVNSLPGRYSRERSFSHGSALHNMVTMARFQKGGKSENNNNNGDNSFYRPGRPFVNGSLGFGSPVPKEQQPVNEYQSLVDSVLFSWALGDLSSYTLKLSAIGTAVSLFLGWPIVAFNMDPEKEFLKCSIGALCGGLLAVTLASLRMYLGWAYVGNRLFSATVEYEETGWYDGQIWIKPPEVLARDRLLGSYKVKPALSRVKLTLIGLAASLVTCTLFFLSIESTKDAPILMNGTNEESISIHQSFSGGAYSDESAQKFEPEAFANEGESMMPDYCY